MLEPDRKPDEGDLPHWLLCKILDIPDRRSVEKTLVDYTPEAKQRLEPIFNWVNDYFTTGEEDPAILKKLFTSAVKVVVDSYPDVIKEASARIGLGDFKGAINCIAQFYRDFNVTDNTIDLRVSDEEAKYAIEELKRNGRYEPGDELFLRRRPSQLTLDLALNLDDFSILVQRTAGKMLQKQILGQLPKIVRIAEDDLSLACRDPLTITELIKANKKIRDTSLPDAERAVAILQVAGQKCSYTVKGLINVMKGKYQGDRTGSESSRNVRNGNLALRFACSIALRQTLRAHRWRTSHRSEILDVLLNFEHETLSSDSNPRLL